MLIRPQDVWFLGVWVLYFFLKNTTRGPEGPATPSSRKKQGNTKQGEESLYRRRVEFASLNVQGIRKQGKREEIEKWMKKHDIAILAVQETHMATYCKETRKTHTCYHSGGKN